MFGFIYGAVIILSILIGMILFNNGTVLFAFLSPVIGIVLPIIYKNKFFKKGSNFEN